MNSQAITEWLIPLSPPKRIRALVLIYSNLTVVSRQFFLPEVPKGNESAIINMLHGVNELHHTVANWFGVIAFEKPGFPVESFCQQLLEIAKQYKIEGLLTSATDLALKSAAVVHR